MSAQRAACCMLWVTMTMVKSRFNSSISSSILAVEIGSSAEVGSSRSTTSGFTAMVRAMQRRCCWPPDRPSAEVLQPVLRPPPTAPPWRATIARARPSRRGRGARAAARRRRCCRRSTSGRASASGTPCRCARAGPPDRSCLAEDVLAVEQHRALGALARIEVVHAVEDAQQGRLAAARRADHRRDLALRHGEVDAFQGLLLAIEEVELLAADLDLRIGDPD